MAATQPDARKTVTALSRAVIPASQCATKVARLNT